MYSFDDECTLRPLPLKTCDPPQTNTPPYPPYPQGMKSDCLPLMCVWIVWILVYTNIYLYIFSFFFLMYILNSTVNFFSKFPPLLETSFL